MLWMRENVLHDFMTYMKDMSRTLECKAKSMMGCYGSVHIIYGVNIKLHIVIYLVMYGNAN